MKISKNTVLLLAAVGLGILCFFGANYYLRDYLTQAEARLAGSYQARQAIVAKVALRAGSTLSTDNLAVRKIPARYLSSTALAPDALDVVAGQKIMVDLQPGDPIDRGALERNDHAALSTTVEKGERAITFPVDEISSISGMLVPGDIIDLIYTGPGNTANSYGRTFEVSGERTAKELLHVRSILQAVPVMATGKTTQKRMVPTEDGGQREVNVDFSTVTLKVSPSQAQQILIAQKLGQLTAVLRNPADKSVLSKTVLDEKAFKQAESPPPITGGKYVETIIGGTGTPGGLHQKLQDDAGLLVAMLKEKDKAKAAPSQSPSALDVRARLGIGQSPAAATPASSQQQTGRLVK